MELTEITTALEGNDELLSGLTTHIMGTDKAKEIIENKSSAMFEQNIGNKTSEIHGGYDNDMFEILGEKPSLKEDGSKQHTYEKNRVLLEELKGLREIKESLNKDSEVQRLKSEVSDLKLNGPGSHWEQTFKSENAKWAEKEAALLERAENAESNILNFRKQADIESGMRGLKFDDTIPEAARKALVDNIVKNLVDKSKVEDGKVVYLKEDGSQMIDSESYKPMNASDILKLALKDVLIDENKNAGGGAPATLTGSIESNSVEGKNVNRLVLQEGSFRSKTEFMKMAEEALMKSGIARTDPSFATLSDDAYNRYNVKELPR